MALTTTDLSSLVSRHMRRPGWTVINIDRIKRDELKWVYIFQVHHPILHVTKTMTAIRDLVTGKVQINSEPEISPFVI